LTTYEIVRFYSDQNKKQRIIQRGLTKEQVQHHCGLESTHKLLPNGDVVWFDGWREE